MRRSASVQLELVGRCALHGMKYYSRPLQIALIAATTAICTPTVDITCEPDISEFEQTVLVELVEKAVTFLVILLTFGTVLWRYKRNLVSLASGGPQKVGYFNEKSRKILPFKILSGKYLPRGHDK